MAYSDGGYRQVSEGPQSPAYTPASVSEAQIMATEAQIPDLPGQEAIRCLGCVNNINLEASLWVGSRTCVQRRQDNPYFCGISHQSVWGLSPGWATSHLCILGWVSSWEVAFPACLTILCHWHIVGSQLASGYISLNQGPYSV